MFYITQYRNFEFKDDNLSSCFTLIDSTWKIVYFILSTVTFFVVPLLILLVIYVKIICNLMIETPKLLMSVSNTAHGIAQVTNNPTTRARKQVIIMLGVVVISFFTCLIPYRAFTLWILIKSLIRVESGHFFNPETYYNVVYFCRIMIYLNSAMNPILYNLMSSKFRDGFRKCLCGSGTNVQTSEVRPYREVRKRVRFTDTDKHPKSLSISYKSSSTHTTNTSSSATVKNKVF